MSAVLSTPSQVLDTTPSAHSLIARELMTKHGVYAVWSSHHNGHDYVLAGVDRDRFMKAVKRWQEPEEFGYTIVPEHPTAEHLRCKRRERFEDAGNRILGINPDHASRPDVFGWYEKVTSCCGSVVIVPVEDTVWRCMNDDQFMHDYLARLQRLTFTDSSMTPGKRFPDGFWHEVWLSSELVTPAPYSL